MFETVQGAFCGREKSQREALRKISTWSTAENVMKSRRVFKFPTGTFGGVEEAVRYSCNLWKYVL